MTILHCRCGEFSVPDRDDLVFNALREYGEWAQEELDLLGKFIRPGDTVIDAGAFIGTHSRAFSELVGSNGSVHAFEPNVASYVELVSNAKLANFSNITTYQVALGGDRTQAYLSSGEGQQNLGASTLLSGNSGEALCVDISRLDDFEFPRIDFIKADTEGTEYELLVGGRESIVRHKPIVFLEANSLQKTGKIIDWAHDIGYAAYGVVSLAFNPNNFRRSPINMFGDARECGLLLINRSQLGEWHDVLSSLRLPEVETVDELALLLFNKPQYFGEVLLGTATADFLGFDSIGFMQNRSAIDDLRQRELEISGLKETLRERELEVSGLKETLAQLLTSTSWRITAPLRFARRLARGEFE